ncbi:uncharacterized protein LOC132262372 [Phlebotomus argentipes]|uniref:uncharacterized protein LOC132262372 n=1 Tax=Phlebotomus argentipes TaxID=94469 RepID=UPI0028931D9C|nr:uncharacterized protein LOC132262372 [Phlebotomus argentipes]
MSKRYSSVFRDKFVQKRAKIEIKAETNVNIHTNLQPASAANAANDQQKTYQTRVEEDDLWDDNDEFLLLASQVADEIEGKDKRSDQKNNADYTDITFERFSREVNSSTQRDQPGCSKFPDGGSRSKPLIQAAPSSEEVMKLRKQIDDLKAENSKISNRYQIRDGEASTLRFELEKLQAIHGSSSAKAKAEAEKMQNALLMKMKDLEKQISALKAENQMRNAVERSFNVQQTNAPKDEDYDLNLPTLDLLRLNFEEDDNFDVLHCKTKTRSIDMDKRLTKFTTELQNIVSCALGRQGQDLVLAELYKDLQRVALKGLIQIKQHSLKLEFATYTDVLYNPTLEHQQLSYFEALENRLGEIDLLATEKLFKSEASIEGRRFLATVAYACGKFPIINHLLETIAIESNDDSLSSSKDSFANVLLKTLYAIGYSTNFISHTMLIHAAAQILLALAPQFGDRADHLKFAGEFFKNLVMSRPQMVTLLTMSRFLLEIQKTKATSGFLKLLCCNSEQSSFVLSELFKIQQFMENSCALQVYCSLLEGIVSETNQCKMSMKPNQWFLDTVMELTLNIVIFFSNCFGDNYDWVKTLFDQTNCDCHNKVTSCLILMIHFILNQWLISGKKRCKKTATVAQHGVLLLRSIFTSNQNIVIRISGEHIQNRLQKICSLTKNYHRHFNFQEVHKCAIDFYPLTMLDGDSHSSDDSPDESNDFFTEFF